MFHLKHVTRFKAKLFRCYTLKTHEHVVETHQVFVRCFKLKHLTCLKRKGFQTETPDMFKASGV